MRNPILHVCLAGLIGLALSLSAPAQSIILTVAGNGNSGYNGDNIPATSAELNLAYGVAVDASSNLYIADATNQRVRKVTASTGIITTVAGTGNYGYNGDDIPATSAELFGPYDVAVDASGNLYISDVENGRIRKVTASTGIITTVAGNGTIYGYNGDNISATSASLFYPYGVAVDSQGNIYIADTGNNRIRKVTATTGIITTVAGDGNPGYSGDGQLATSAELSGPATVAVDASGNLFIADSERVRKVTAATGIITTVAGDGVAGYNGDNIPAASAELYFPYGVAVDASGNLYIGDAGNNRIRKVTATTGIITTVAGDGIPGYSGDGQVATSAELNGPTTVAVDASGNLFIADNNNSRIREVTAQGQTATPTFTPHAGTYFESQTVTISDVTLGAMIYCTTGSTAPLPIAADVCSNPIELNSQTTLNAIATAPGVNPPGYNKSVEVSESYQFRVAEVNFVNEVPSASGASMTVYLSDETPDATIYYTTDGALPLVGAAYTSPYAGPIVVTMPETIKVIGVLTGYENSSMSTKHVILPAAQPVISPGTSVLHAPQTVTITDATAGAPLYCVLNGAPAVPCAGSYQVNSREEIQAYAEGGGFDRSVQTTAFYTMKVASPTLSFKTGTYPRPLQVTLLDATPGAAIYYTTDGSTPVPGNTATYRYNNSPVLVSTTETVKVIAVLTGYETSSLAEAAYIIQ